MPKRQKIWDALYPLVFALISLIIATVIGTILSGMITGIYDTDSPELASLSLWISILFYTFVLIYQGRRFPKEDLRFWPDAKKADPVFAVSAAAACVCLGDLLTRLIYGSGFAELFPEYQNVAVRAFENQNPLLLIAATVLLAPPAEELLFRGMTYRRTASYLGTKRGIVISALLFGIYHMNAVQFLYGFVLGLLLAWIYETSHTLLVPVIAHAASNLYSILTSYVISPAAGTTVFYRIALPVLEAAVLALTVWLLFRNSMASNSDEFK